MTNFGVFLNPCKIDIKFVIPNLSYDP